MHCVAFVSLAGPVVLFYFIEIFIHVDLSRKSEWKVLKLQLLQCLKHGLVIFILSV